MAAFHDLPEPSFALLKSEGAKQDGYPPNAILCKANGSPGVVIVLHPDVDLDDAVELAELLRERVCGVQLAALNS
jgi:hypothetical protein